MNYIGSKLSLLDFLKESIEATLKRNKEIRKIENLIFADGFAGTGIVGTSFKKIGCEVLSNDIQFYSYVMIRHYVGNNRKLLFTKINGDVFQILNSLTGIRGFIYENYSLGGTQNKEFQRMYYSDDNAKKCDAIRQKIENWHNDKTINDDEYFYLLACLLNAIDKVANTASVYGAYLKKFKKSATQPLIVTPLEIIESSKNNTASNMPIETWIKNVEGDVLYLDPPYNARQYCTNYHMLETIAKYDNPIIHGMTGLREYSDQKSDWCSKAKVCNVFETIIKEAKFKYIFLSYNNEGLMSLDDVKKIMEKYGDYKLEIKQYKRFKADSQRENKADSTYEYLHCLIKR